MAATPTFAMTVMGALAVGLGAAAVSLSVYALGFLVAQARGADDRAYRDAPPPWLRCVWPLLLVIDPATRRLLGPGPAARIGMRLARGGLDYALTPAQFFSGQCVYAGIGAVSSALLTGSMAGGPDGAAAVGWLGLGAAAGFALPALWLRDRTHRRQRDLLRALPFFLDLVTLAVESGLNLASAVQKAVEKIPPGPLTSEMNRVLRDVRAGRPRVEALRELARRQAFAPLTSLVSALVQGELTGASLGDVLRAQSAQRRTERFQRAEKQAMEAPVKLLAPLVLCIFPCTFIVIGFPIVVKLMTSGL
jgi:tight adherence protein C